jgi:RND superfamily putative drug exporter
MARLLHRIGGAAVRHRRLVLLVWVLGALSLFGISKATGVQLNDEFRIGGIESQKALDLMVDRFPEMSGTTAQVVFHTEHGTFDDPAQRAARDRTMAAITALPHVATAVDPALATSADHRTSMSFLQYDLQGDDLPKGTYDALVEATEVGRDSGIQVELGGELVRYSVRPETGPAEGIGIAAAIVILLMAFGSVIAGGMPIGLALFGLGTGFSLVTIVAAFTDIPTVAPMLASMIGLGVGIDYALFVITRHRQHLTQGMTVEEAAARANATAGQAVVFAGGTVLLAICGLALVGIPFVASMGYAAAMVVGVMVLATITLLPALLGFAGMKLATSSLPWAKRREAREAEALARGEQASGAWLRWGDHVSRHPWRYLIASVTLLGLLAVPLFSMHLGQTDAGNDPKGSTSRKAYDLVTDGFGPGLNGPLLLSVKLTGEATVDQAQLATLVDGLRADDDVLVAPDATVNPAGDAAMVTVIPKSAPESAATADLVHRIRDDLAPRSPKLEVYTGGLTATFIDIADRVQARMPLFIGAIVAMSFLLLVLVFRSILVPLKAALLNVLSIGAAYGVVVAVFQWGWGKGLIGLESTVPIVSFVPMFMFAILFGLSMDYEVFLLSRVREEYLHTRDNAMSVTTGIATTARVIASAALIMISVFFGFVLGEDPIVKMMGLGLAVAVFLDATIVRVVLVPASMKLMGHANWWLPGWLDRILPHLDIEGDSGLPAPAYRDGCGPAVREALGPAPAADEVVAAPVPAMPAAVPAMPAAVPAMPAAYSIEPWMPPAHPSTQPAGPAVAATDVFSLVEAARAPAANPESVPSEIETGDEELVALVEEAFAEAMPDLEDVLERSDAAWSTGWSNPLD